MKFYLFVLILPCILANNDSHIECPDKSACPVGQTCCENSEQYSCCDVEEHEKENKKMIPALPAQFQKDLVEPEVTEDDVETNANCSGTLCSSDWCCDYQTASCCSNSTSCCPGDYKCCGIAPPQVWCCKTKQRCADTFLYCIAGAHSLSSTFLSVIVMLIIAVSLKHI